MQSSAGLRLRTARQRKDLTQDDVSYITQLSVSTISRAENNPLNFKLLKLLQICSVCHVSIFQILNGSALTPLICFDGDIVVVDDSNVQLAIYSLYLEREFPGMNVLPFTSSTAADKWLRRNQARLIITDYRMPELTGEQLLKNINTYRKNVNTPTILMTSEHEKEVISRIARDENAIFYDKSKPKSVLFMLVADILRIA